MDYYNMAAFSFSMDGNAYRPATVEKLFRDIRFSDKYAKLSEEEKRDMRSAFNEMLRPLRYTGITERTNRLPRLPHDYQYDDAKPKAVIKAKTVMGEEVTVKKGEANIEVYADWMTSKSNPRFAKVIANRLWKKAFGLGLIEPVDDFTEYTEPSNPELMAFLESQMKEVDYDMKAFLAMLYKTRTYSREASRDEVPLGATYHFTGPILRRMSAEQVWDSIVTLVNPHPDRPNYIEMERAAQRIENTRKLSEALYKQTPKQLIDGAKAISQKQKEVANRLREIQEGLVEAKAAKDKAKIRELSIESRDLRIELREHVQDKVYKPFMDGPTEAGDLAVPISSSDGMMPGYSMPTPGEVRAMKQWQEEQYRAKAKEMGLNSKEIQYYKLFYRNVLTKAQRAANISSPAPRGHFLREFGQSDREIIENASDEASVPQALQMLNGPVFQAVASRFSALNQSVSDEEDAKSKIDAIFLSLLSRHATEDEKAYILPMMAERKGAALSDTIYALLNTRQFLFIQ